MQMNEYFSCLHKVHRLQLDGSSEGVLLATAHPGFMVSGLGFLVFFCNEGSYSGDLNV